MRSLKIKGKTVELGTVLRYLDDAKAKSDPNDLLPEFVTVVDITSHHIVYEGDGVDGEAHVDHMHKTFEVYEHQDVDAMRDDE